MLVKYFLAGNFGIVLLSHKTQPMKTFLFKTNVSLKSIFLLTLFIFSFSFSRAQTPTLWGMTSQYNYGYGNIISYHPGDTISHDDTDFGGYSAPIGSLPYYGNLVMCSDTFFYGMTYWGGATIPNGNLFKYNPITKAFVDLHDFKINISNMALAIIFNASL